MNSESVVSKRKVFIVDDHPIVCEALIKLINNEKDLAVCGKAQDISDALQPISECQPDIAIIEIPVGKNSGFRLIEKLSICSRGLSVLVFSVHDESIYAERCLKAGASGYIMKGEPTERVITALRRALNGEVYISENLQTTLFNKLVSNRFKTYNSPIESLSNRELEVFQLIGQGLQTRLVALELDLSIKTIETYIEHIKLKMNFRSLHELTAYAMRWLITENMI